VGEARKCANCGAIPSRSDGKFCEFCGAELPVESTPAIIVGPFGDLAARFRALGDHPDLERIRQHTPSTSRPAVGMVVQIVFGVIFTIASLVIFGGFQMGAPFPMSLFPLLFVAVGIGMVVMGIKNAASYSAAPLQRIEAIVVDERTRVAGGGRNSSSSTSYYATLESPDGERREYQIDGRLSGEITRGDIGVAFIKSMVLVDFQRVAV